MEEVVIQVDGDAEAEPMDGERENKLEKVFSKDVVKRMADYWTRIRDNDYTEEEIPFLLFEVVQYHTVVDQKLVDHRLRSVLPSCFKWCTPTEKGAGWKEESFITGKTEWHQPSELDIKIQVPYVERKRMSEQARALFLQFTLELVSFITDVAFLFLLYDFDKTLFVVSLTVLIVAMVARLIASIVVGHRVKIYPLYLLGLLVALVETNSGLRLIKLSLDRTPESGIKNYRYGARLSRTIKKDAISVLAETSRRVAWNEVIYIFCVGLLEDIPQLVIQAVFVSQSEEALSLLSQVTIGSTVVHIIFQLIEALISLRAICGELPLIADGREMSYDEYGNLATRYDTPFDKGVRRLCTRRFRKGKSVCRRVKEDMKKYGTYIRSLDLVEVRHYIDATVYEQIVSSCKNIQVFKAKGKHFTDEVLCNLAKVSSNVEFLDVGESALTGTSFRVVSKRKRLVSCVFIGCQLDDTSFKEILANARPKFFPLSMSNVDNTTVNALIRNMNSIMGNFQFSTTNIDDDSLFALAQHPKPAVVWKLLLGGTRVGDRGVEVVCSTFANLAKLSLARTSLTNQGLLFVAKCEKLTWLELSKTKVKDMSVKVLVKSATKLERLYLDETCITLDSVDMILAYCSVLEFLIISNNRLSTGNLDHLTEGFEHNLKRLDVANTHVSASHLEQVIRVCHELSYLDLKNYELMRTETVKTVSECECLQDLLCDGVQFTNEWLQVLSGGKLADTLHTFAFEGEVVNGEGFKRFGRLCSKLLALNIGSAGEATHEDVVNLAKRCRNLTELGLCDAKNVGDDTIKRVSCVCKNIRKLELDHTGISSKSLRYISKRWPLLSTLSLRGTFLQGSAHQLTCEHIVELDLSFSGIDNADVDVLCQTLRKVTDLQLDRCPISDSSLSKIGEVWMLTLLTVVGCSDVTNDGIIELCARTPTVAALYFGETSIGDSAVNAVMDFCPGLKIVGIVDSKVTDGQIQRLRKARIEVENQSLYLASRRRTLAFLFR